MIYVVRFTDMPGKADLRQANMAAHLDFLDTQRGVLAAGPVFDTDGDGRGGLWLVEAGSATEVEDMVATDPLTRAGLRESMIILEWRQVFREGRRI